jgi:hypothetical protein
MTRYSPALLLVLVLGCGPSYSDLRKKNPAIEARLKLIESVGAKIPSLDSAPDGLEAAEPPPVFPPANGRENAVAVDYTDLKDLASRAEATHLVTDDYLRDAAAWARKGTQADGRKPAGDLLSMFEDKINRVLAARYALILRTTGGVDPQSNGGAIFTGGKWRGEAWFFDLDQQRFLGRLRFEARNSSSLQTDPQDQAAYLLNDLRDNALRLVHDEFKKRYPGGTPPFWSQLH